MAGDLPEGFACQGLLDHPDDERCEFSPADVEAVKRFFPSNAEFLDPNCLLSSDCVSNAWICFLEYPFLIGLTFPFPPLINRFFETTGLAFAQLMPVGWRNLVTLERFNAEIGLEVDLEELGFCYDLRSHGSKRFGFRVKTRANSLVTDSIDKDRKWKNRFFYVRRSSLVKVEKINSFWLTEGLKLDELFPKRKETLSIVQAVCTLSPKKRKFVRPATWVEQEEEEEVEGEKSSSKTLQVAPGMSYATPSQAAMGDVKSLIARFKKPKNEDVQPAIPKAESSKPKLMIGDIVAFKKRKVDLVDADAADPIEKKLGQKIQDASSMLVCEVQLWKDKAQTFYQAKIKAEEKLLAKQKEMDAEIKKKEEEIKEWVMKVAETNRLNRIAKEATEEYMTREAGKMVFEARIQMIEEYQVGKHLEWNLEEEQAALKRIKDEEVGEVNSKSQEFAAVEHVGENQGVKVDKTS